MKLLADVAEEDLNAIDRELERWMFQLELSMDDLMSILDISDGVVEINTDMYNKLIKSTAQQNFFKENIGTLDDLVSAAKASGDKIDDAYNDSLEKRKESFDDYMQKQLEIQETLLDAYRNQLEKEQESLQESLDKRKEMYEKYFDAIEEEESDENFEEQQAKLQRAIAALSSASDATSLAKRKELEQQLEELEDEQLSTERERRREAVMANLDNESEMVDDYYEKMLEDNRKL